LTECGTFSPSIIYNVEGIAVVRKVVHVTFLRVVPGLKGENEEKTRLKSASGMLRMHIGTYDRGPRLEALYFGKNDVSDFEFMNGLGCGGWGRGFRHFSRASRLWRSLSSTVIEAPFAIGAIGMQFFTEHAKYFKIYIIYFGE
jgi:hypothetical protein